MTENEEEICLKPIQYMVRNRQQKQISFYHLKTMVSKPKKYNRQLTKTNKTLNWFSICSKVEAQDQQQYIDKQDKYQSNSEILVKFLAKNNRENQSKLGEGCSFMVNTYMSTPKQSQSLTIETTKNPSRCRTQKQRMTPTNFCKFVMEEHVKKYTESQQKEDQEFVHAEQKKARKKTFIKLCKQKEEQTKQASKNEENIIRFSSVKLKRTRKCKTQF